MKEVITMRSVQLTDEDIAFCISAVCTKLLGRPVTCRTYCDVNEYWGAISDEQKFTTKEIAELLNISQASVKMRLVRGRKRLKFELSEGEES